MAILFKHLTTPVIGPVVWAIIFWAGVALAVLAVTR